MRALDDDDEILRLAEQDGVAMTLRERLARMDGVHSVIITQLRVYLIYACRGDSGYGCFEVDTPDDMALLLLRMAPQIGPFERVFVGHYDTDTSQPGSRH